MRRTRETQSSLTALTFSSVAAASGPAGRRGGPVLRHATVAVRALHDRVALYGGGGVTWLRPRFQAGFTGAAGVPDATRARVDLARGALTGGVAARLARTVDLGAQVYAVPVDVTTWRLGVGYQLH